MNIAIVAFENESVEEGLSELFGKYTTTKINAFIPVTEGDTDFVLSALDACKRHQVHTTGVVESTDGLEEFIIHFDEVLVSENPVKEVIDHLQTGDALAIAWDDSPQAHYVVHAVEDLAIDTWDVTDGLSKIESEIEITEMDSEALHDVMHESLGTFIDALTAFVASAVMESLGQAIAEHIVKQDKKDINPFDEEK